MGGRFFWFMYAGMLACTDAFADASEAENWDKQTLTGSWGGARTSLNEKGVAVALTHKSDFLRNVSGGIQSGSVWLANTEAAISMDMDKLAGWGGTTAFIQYHIQHGKQGKDFNGSYVGSFAGVSNIETGTETGKFWQAWIQKNLADDKLSILAGLYTIDSEFYVTETSGLFLQPPYGMSSEMAQANPPVFPTGALGLRIKYSATDGYLQAAMTDGVPGDPNNPNGTHIQLNKGDGTLSIVEFGYTPAHKDKSINKTALGLWNYTAKAADQLTGENRTNRGYYLLAERTLMTEQGSEEQGLSGFVRYGVVNKDVYQSDWSASVGLHYVGMIDGRDDDEAGIAITSSHASEKYRQLTGSDSSEMVIEITCRTPLRPWLAVQPSLQRIINPGMDKSLKDATVVGVRVEMSL